MKVVAEFPDRHEAIMAKGFLESAGIKAHVSADDEGGLHPALGAQKGARLMVSDQDVAKAEEILKALNEAPPLDEDQ